MMGNKVDCDRIEYIDIAKGMAILCVILGHMGWEYADRVIYPFHMPLFLLCSGYFISEKKSFDCFRKEKARRLLVPYIVICGGVCILSVLANLVQGLSRQALPDLVRWIYASIYGSCIDYESPFIIKGIGQIWFLLALFWACLIVRYWGVMKEGIAIILLLAYMAYVSSEYMWLPFSVQAGAVCAIYVYIGYELGKRHLFHKKFSIWFFAFSVAVWIFEAWFDIRVNLCNNTIDAKGFSILGSLLISCVVIQIAKCFDKANLFKRSLTFCGKNSLLILCFHEFETYFFPWSIVYGMLGKAGVFGIAADGIIFILKVFFCTAGAFTAVKIAHKQLRYLGFGS